MVVKSPAGRGSSEQFVQSRLFREELEACRRRKNASCKLAVMIDGDNQGVERRLRALDAACRKASVPVRQASDGVAIFVPTWNIETWLAYLDGENVQENHSTYRRLDRPRKCQRHVNALKEMCDHQRLRKPSPPSLAAACHEYKQRT